jgi:bacteriocin-like protein
MTNDSKNEADKPTTNDSSREITTDELNQVVGGTYPKQKPDGTAGGNVVGGWDLIANKHA